MTTTGTSSGSAVTGTATYMHNATFYTNSEGATINPFIVETGLAAEIVLTTPFVFLPAQGKTGATTSTRCYQSDDTEMYGYVPQTLVDILRSDRHYVSQYPDLPSCLPGGPSMLRRQTCFNNIPQSVVYQIPEGGDLSRTTVITVTPPGETKFVPQSLAETTTPAGGKGPGNHLDGATGQPAPPATQVIEGGPEASSNVQSVANENPNDPLTHDHPAAPPVTSNGNNGAGNPQGAPPAQTSVGAIINSMFGANGGQPGGAVFITPPAGQPIPASLGSTTFISGTPVFVIPSATTVPAAGLPAGIGSTTMINGTPFVVIQPTTIPIPAGTGGQQTFSTTLINGTPFVIIPGVTTMPALPGSLMVISGTLVDIFTGPTTVQVNSELPLEGITTVISGTTMVILPGATTVPVKPGGTASPSYIQVSSASPRKVSWIGFGLGLLRGFVLRFR